MVAELFPVGELLVGKLAARGWSAEEFARFMGLPMELVSGIISGKGELTEQVATKIGQALGMSAGLWLGLHHDYLAWKGAQDAIVDCQKKTHARNHMVVAYFLSLWCRALE